MTRLEEIKERCEKATPKVSPGIAGPENDLYFFSPDAVMASQKDIPWLVSQLEKAIELAELCLKHRFDAVPFDVQDKARGFLEQMK